MNSFLEWKLALRNLSRNKRRTLSTATALIIAFVGIAVLSGHVYNVHRSVKTSMVYGNRLGHISIFKKDGIDKYELRPDLYEITADELKIVDEIVAGLGDRIEKRGAVLWAPGLLSTGKRSLPVLIAGTDLGMEEYARDHASIQAFVPEFAAMQERPFLFQAVKEVPDAISIARGVRELLGLRRPFGELSSDEKEVVLAARTRERAFNAVNGTIATTHMTGMPFLEDTSIVVPLQLARELVQSQGASHMILFLKNERQTQDTIEKLQSEFDARRLSVEALPFADDRIGLFYNGTMSFLLSIVSFFSVLIIGASVLIIVNSMTMALLERAREMGTLRAFGFTPQRVRGLFVKEAFWLAGISSGIAIVLAEMIGYFVNRMHIMYETPGIVYRTQLRIIIPPWIYLPLTLVIVVIATGFSFWLVRRKTRERIAVLLLESGAAL
ncbi:MAG: FtsX-like permease family protein [Bdellovibrionaceae bacterium]|nr:FtsX-like permease family protein [Pseudobdellovibrionaceae bacterium]